jgi:hypothetical protein
MPHIVPPFEWSDDALKLRDLNYRHWCEHGHGPNLRDVHEALGLGRREAIEVYKELMLGIACTIEPDALNVPVLRFQPFASFPTQVKAYVDDVFHSYAGCAMEAVAFGNMPPFRNKRVRLESYSHPDPRVQLAVRLVQRRPHEPVRRDELRYRCRPCRTVRTRGVPARCGVHPATGQDLRVRRSRRAHVELPQAARTP